MIRTVGFAVAALALAACDPGAWSREPLLAAGPHPIREGLWAVLAEGCVEPRSSAVASWDSCAIPVWVARDSASYIALGKVSAAVRWAEGEPALLQLTAIGGGFTSGPPPWLGPRDNADARDVNHAYFLARGEGDRPYSRGRVWQAPCAPGGDEGGDDRCLVRSLPELRTLATEAVGSSPGFRAVWIAAG